MERRDDDEHFQREAVIDLGEVSIRPIDEFTVWLEHESGEGLQIEKKLIAPLLVKVLEENL